MPTNQAAPAVGADTDPLQDLHDEIQRHAAALQRRWTAMPPSPADLGAEMTGTVLAFLRDIVATIAQVRDTAVDGLAEHEARFDDLDEPSTRILPEHAEMFTACFEGVKLLIGEVRRGGTHSSEALAKLEALETVAAACLAVVAEHRVEVDEDEAEAQEQPALPKGIGQA